MSSSSRKLIGYILESIGRAVDFMVDRAWFDVVALFAAELVPGPSENSAVFQRVMFVLLFSVGLFSVREALSPHRVSRTGPSGSGSTGESDE